MNSLYEIGLVALGAAGGAGAGFLVGLRHSIELRIRRLGVANRMLARHHRALAALDNDDTPTEMLAFAIKFAKVIQNPETPKAVAYILSVNPTAFSLKNLTQKMDWDPIFKQARKELLEAFYISLAAGMGAFVSRWPECEGMFNDILVDLAASPVGEAEIVISATDKALSYLNVSEAAFAH